MAGHLPYPPGLKQPSSVPFEFSWRTVQEFQNNSKSIIQSVGEGVISSRVHCFDQWWWKTHLFDSCSINGTQKYMNTQNAALNYVCFFSSGQWQRWAERGTSNLSQWWSFKKLKFSNIIPRIRKNFLTLEFRLQILIIVADLLAPLKMTKEKGDQQLSPQFYLKSIQYYSNWWVFLGSFLGACIVCLILNGFVYISP